MANSLAFSVGRLVGKNKLITCLGGGILLAYLLWPATGGAPPQALPTKQTEPVKALPVPAPIVKTEAQKQTEDVAAAAAKKRELAKWKKEGVNIGMTAERVLLSSWGKPESVNRTTNAFGVREQWVYGGGNYLYFQDGVLTSIQN